MAVYSIRKDGLGDFTTVGAFLAAAAPGDEGRIDDSSTYNESVTVTKNNIRLFVATGQSPTITNWSVPIKVSSGVTGFRLDGPVTVESTGSGGSAIKLLGGNLKVDLSRVRTTKGTALIEIEGSQSDLVLTVTACKTENVLYLINGGDVGTLAVKDCAVRGGTCLLKANVWGGIIERCSIMGKTVLEPIASTQTVRGSPIIRNVLFRNVEATVSPAIPVWSANVRVRECTLIREDKQGVGYQAVITSSAPIFQNCVAIGFNYGFASTYSGAQAVTDHCLAWGYGTAGWGGAAVKQASDLIADPLILDYDTGEIAKGSPCRNTGTDTGTPDDIRGVARPQEGAYDRGCWEYLPPEDYRAEVSRYRVYATDLSGNPLPGFPDPEVGAVGPLGLVELAHLVLIKLWSDRRAEAHDVLPGGDTDRRGWWADTYDSEPLGSRLWLLLVQPVDDDLISRIKSYVEEALAGLIDDGIVTGIEVEVEAGPKGQARDVRMAVTVMRERDGVRLTWPDLWEALEG